MQIFSKKKFICFLLAVSMLISGMCFEEVQADFLLMDENNVQSVETYSNSMKIEDRGFDSGKIFHKISQSKELTSTMFSIKERIFSPEVRAEEILVRGIAAVCVKAVRKAKHRLGDSFLQSKVFPKEPGAFFGYSYLERYSQIYSNEIVIGYIHEKDGKKGSVYIVG